MNELIAQAIKDANVNGVADRIDCESGEEGLGLRIFENFAKAVIMAAAHQIRMTDYGEVGDNSTAEFVADDIEEWFGITE